MENIPAASTMDWSIDLDKGLRSRHPSTRIRALVAVGPRLRQLGISPSTPEAVASAFGVVPCEARLFGETMLLRLASKFKSGDDCVRGRIVRSLVLEYRELARKRRAYDGVLSRASMVESDEVLRRVKAVYDTGGVRARALALQMFGCLADIAKDSVHVRYLVLSSLASSNVVEVKAALFTAGCFCWLSEDFTCITIEVLRRLVSSPRLDVETIWAAMKAFSKLDCTLAVIHRAHKVGKQMLLGTLEELFKAEMLFSLSKLSFKSITLFGAQVELLLLFLGHECSLSMKTTALKCLFFMFHRSTCHFAVSRKVFSTLLQAIDSKDLPLCCKYDALRILQKIFCSKAPDMQHIDGPELSKLVLAAESVIHSSSWEMQDIALKTLVDIFCFLKQTRKEQPTTNNMLSTSEENDHDRHVNKIITVIMNHTVSLVNQVIIKGNKKVSNRIMCMSSTELRKKYKALLSLMLKLAKHYPCAGAVVLDKLVKELVRLNDNDDSEAAVKCVELSQTGVSLAELNSSKDSVEHVATNIEASHMKTDAEIAMFACTEFNSKKKASIMCDIILCTFRFAIACLNMLCKTATASGNLYHTINALIECVQQDASQYCWTYESFCILMHACRIKDRNEESRDSKVQPTMFFTPSIWIVQELCAVRITKMLLRKKRYWDAYRSAMYCCNEGLWFTASILFRKLADSFESSSSSFWFKSLLLFSASEIELKLLLFPKAITKLIDELQAEGDLSKDLYYVEADVDSILGGPADLHSNRGKITGICSRTYLANDALASKASSDCEFSFQSWFISLRASFLEILVDILSILSTHSSAQTDTTESEAKGEGHLTIGREHINNHVLALANCSLRLSDLAKSYDLLAVSHMDMDHQSFTSIARVAFVCSLLAFCTAFSVDFSKIPNCENAVLCRLAKRFSHASILQDLHERTYGSDDGQIVSQLQQFMSFCFDDLDSLQSSTQMNCCGHLEKDSYLLYQFAVEALVCVHGGTKGVTNEEETLSPLYGAMQFLSSILQKLMEFPFRVPKYFFRVRPCLGAELFVFDSNPVNKHGISISPGFQLSLTLCMQWKSVIARTSIRPTRLYCILAASSKSCLDGAGMRGKQFEICKTARMVEMNNILLQYIRNDLRKACDNNDIHSDTGLVTAFACFEPTDSGQGFSDCMLNVSSFCEGSYQIKWHACCVDENGSYWSLLPLNDGAVFSIRKC